MSWQQEDGSYRRCPTACVISRLSPVNQNAEGKCVNIGKSSKPADKKWLDPTDEAYKLVQICLTKIVSNCAEFVHGYSTTQAEIIHYLRTRFVQKDAVLLEEF